MSDLAPIFSTQNLNDDDAAVIDSYLIETDAPPKLEDAVEPIPVPALPPAPVPQILITGTIIINSAYTVFQLLPPDVRRKFLTLTVVSTVTGPTLEDYVIIADDNGKVSAGASGGIAAVTRLRTQPAFTGTSLNLPGYNGPIFVAPNPSITAAIELTWTAVTE